MKSLGYFVVVCWVVGVAPTGAASIVQWDFNGSLESSNGGHPLTVGFAAPASRPGLSWDRATIGQGQAQVARFERGTWLRVEHGFAPNAIGFIDSYTLVMDVKLDTPPKRRRSWRALVQTRPNNHGNAVWGVNRRRRLGTYRGSGGKVIDGRWHRLALVYSVQTGTVSSFINGKRVAQRTRQGQGSRFLLEPSLLLFADNDKENIGGQISSLQLHHRALSDAEIAKLGAPTALGIPRPKAAAPRPPVHTEITAAAGKEITVRWDPGPSPQGLVELVVRRPDGKEATALTVPAQSGGLTWRVDPWAPAGTHRLFLGWGQGRKARVHVLDVAVTMTGERPPSRPPTLGRQLVRGDDFQGSWAEHWQVSGAPVGSLNGRLVARASGDFRVWQDIDLRHYPQLALAMNQGLSVHAQARLGSDQPPWRYGDQSWFEVHALGAQGQVLRTFASLHDRGPEGVVRRFIGHLPKRTAGLRIELFGKHLRGKKNAAWMQDVSLRVTSRRTEMTPTPRTLTKGPFLQDVRGDAMTVIWETNFNPVAPFIAMTSSASSPPRMSDVPVETRRIDRYRFVHVATLRGLKAQTRYRYRVGADDVSSRTYAFQTAPGATSPFSIAWLSDNQYGWRTFRSLIPKVAQTNPDLAIFPGDIVQNGYDLRDWHTQWFESLRVADFVATTPLIFARGNHDGEWPYAYGYSSLPEGGSFYSFTYGNSFVIVLDTESNRYTSAVQTAWLRQQLASAAYRNAAFRIVTMHKPPYTNLWDGRHEYDGEAFVRDVWVPLFERARVDLVVAGHAHAYERGRQRGVTYVVVGGAGGRLDDAVSGDWNFLKILKPVHHYNLMRVDGRKLQWQAFDSGGRRIDRFVLKSRRR